MSSSTASISTFDGIHLDLPQRPRFPVNTSDPDDIMVIGIDFGTTFSGVAWATKADFETEDINFVTLWPGSGREEGKVPSEIFYEDGEVLWGYEIPSNVDPISWFKLLLLRDEDLSEELKSSEFILRARRMMRENEKTAVQMVADYLRFLWRHALDVICSTRGRSVVNALAFHVVITVPAIWKGYARQSMRAAAQLSGILDARYAGPTVLTLAPEPEVAALCTLSEPSRIINEGEVYIICDAGGGTVDLISYEIETASPIRIHEAVEGAGGLCGSIFIDEEFEIMCKNRLGRKWGRLSKVGIKDIMKGEWEQSIKPQFNTMNIHKEYIVAVPAEAFTDGDLNDRSRQPYIRNGRIHYLGSDIEKAFTKVFTNIRLLIEEQIKQANKQGLRVAGIILVGGLGGSPYLAAHLRAQYAKAKIDILQSSGMKPRTAICRGAVFKGFLDYMEQQQETVADADSLITLTSTISRASYGVTYKAIFKEGKHDIEDRFWDDKECIYKANNQMRWFLKRGDNVSLKNSVRHHYYRMRTRDWDGQFAVNLYQCEDATPPTRFTESVTKIGKITCNGVPSSAVQEYFNPEGKRFKRLDYDVEMVPSGASVNFAVYVGKKKLGVENANISFE